MESMRRKELKWHLIDQQTEALLQRATVRPMPEDPMGMIGLLSAIVASRMTGYRLQAEFEERLSGMAQEPDDADKK